MQALYFDGQKLELKSDYPNPSLRPGWAVIRVVSCGICRTDLELTRGYMGFSGVLGHEFVGIVDACEDTTWVGQRVVGEINAACGTCDSCRKGLERHCPDRSVLGIHNLDGCMAEYCTLPVANLKAVPARLSDDQAVFAEPLSAACEIMEQVSLDGSERCVVLGDGKLGILCAWVLATALDNVTLVGHHQEKLERAAWKSLMTESPASAIEPGADIVVDATGSGDGFIEAMRLCRPRGTLVLKSTVASQGDLNLSPLVINEITLVGSRCGLLEHGLSSLVEQGYPVERLITARYPLAQAEDAFERAGAPDALKVVLDVS